MWKKTCGLVMGMLLIAAVGGYGSGCNSTDSSTVPAGSCATDASGAPKFRPPLHYAGACNEGQLKGFKTACIDGTSETDGTACNAFLDDTATNGACTDCLFVPENNTANFGAFLDVFVNKPGYVSFLNASAGCVSAYHDAFMCDVVACSLCPPDGVSPQACDDKVLGQNGQCEPALKIYQTACASKDDQAALDAASTATTNDILGVMTAFCGNAPSGDGGLDGSTDGGDSGNADGAADTGTHD